MPRLWTETVAGHRAAVREAALDAVAALVVRHGLRGVTMSQVAEDAGIGRATLYKYFPDVDAMIAAWHERQVTAHLDRLVAARDAAGDAGDRLARGPARLRRDRPGTARTARGRAGGLAARERARG